jgi:hypothetical protein
MDRKPEVEMWKLRLALGIALATGLLRAFRMPNDWASAHWLINYDFGLVKRGLVGELIQPLIKTLELGEIQTLINVLSTTLTAAWAATIFCVAIATVRRCQNPLPTVLAIMAVFIGPYVVMMGHINGYYDGIAIMAAALGCWCVHRNMPWVAGTILALAILCHETTLLYGAPAVAFAIVAKNYRKGELACWGQLFRCGLPIAAGAGLMFALREQDQTVLAQLLEHVKGLGFLNEKHVQVPHAITSGFLLPWEVMYPLIWKTLTDSPYLVQIGIPTVCLLAVVSSQFVKGQARIGMTMLAALCTLAPLAIHVVAWDTTRIWTYPLGNGLLILWAACTYGTKKEASVNPWLIALGGLAIAVALASETPLMDELVTRGTWQTALMGYIPALALALWALPGFRGPEEKLLLTSTDIHERDKK